MHLSLFVFFGQKLETILKDEPQFYMRIHLSSTIVLILLQGVLLNVKRAPCFINHSYQLS